MEPLIVATGGWSLYRPATGPAAENPTIPRTAGATMGAIVTPTTAPATPIATTDNYVKRRICCNTPLTGDAGAEIAISAPFWMYSANQLSGNYMKDVRDSSHRLRVQHVPWPLLLGRRPLHQQRLHKSTLPVRRQLRSRGSKHLRMAAFEKRRACDRSTELDGPRGLLHAGRECGRAWLKPVCAYAAEGRWICYTRIRLNHVPAIGAPAQCPRMQIRALSSLQPPLDSALLERRQLSFETTTTKSVNTQQSTERMDFTPAMGTAPSAAAFIIATGPAAKQRTIAMPQCVGRYEDGGARHRKAYVTA
ncbi:hypothetical protein IMY05_C4372000200 [Salix suchowensis]|nr:hypothetical protein IMY05_C4372000200 [Salix suchowensis]